MNSLFSKLKSKLAKIDIIHREIIQMRSDIVKLQESLGRIESRQLEIINKNNLHHHEFRIFSQWGEDGIIQFLINNIKIKHKVFIEFGVETYVEANTRFLLKNNNWSGLVIDGNENNIQYIKNDPLYWQYNLKAVHSFITKDNINQIITDNGIEGEIGILSVDIDGNDYWVWQAINVVNPAIVIIEYNFRFGKDRSVTIPYNPSFYRTEAHHSTIYFGASLKALCKLANAKGYAFVGCNSSGVNAFFVRRDLKPDFMKELSPEEGYISGQFRESRDEKGNLAYLNLAEEQKILYSLPLQEI